MLQKQYLPPTDLETLELCCTNVDLKVILEIGEKAPSSKHITLASCFALNDDGSSGNVFRVSLPYVALQVCNRGGMFIQRPEMDELKYINEALRDTQTAHFYIKTRGAAVKYFMLKPEIKKTQVRLQFKLEKPSINKKALVAASGSLQKDQKLH
ncbi:hypothetical protein MAM1_0036c02687 [Mucor ambiguus]|uniref:Uncharacterized protein n=1 Tax=Mucor ambiguus TaxID=91626 RepID=A0A0C9LSX4_9FUNG|nr:hypothetical protein MAM1_0036c02687 [Mucor ambiguus]